MTIKTADLCDQFSDVVCILELPLRSFGGRTAFSGRIETIAAFEDNSLVRTCVGEPGKGKVLVVDGGGSMRRAMLGDNLAAKAVENGWEGIIIHGCIRDSADIAQMDLGVFALGTHPLKTEKRNLGDRNVSLRFGGITVHPGEFLYADEDGVVISSRELNL